MLQWLCWLRVDFGLTASIEAFCTIETAGLDTASGGAASTRALETMPSRINDLPVMQFAGLLLIQYSYRSIEQVGGRISEFARLAWKLGRHNCVCRSDRSNCGFMGFGDRWLGMGRGELSRFYDSEGFGWIPGRG